MQRASRLVILEGNISAGKSTLSRDLGNLLGYHVFLEPTISNPYLANFYADPKKYALKMQLWLLKQRFRTYVHALKTVMETGQGVILDRSVWSDWVFAEKNRKDGNITPEGFEQYSRLRARLLEGLPVPQATVYLDVKAAECYRRVHSLRCRDVEVGIPLEYLAGLGECYEQFVTDMASRGSRLLRVDWNQFGNSRQVALAIQDDSATVAAAATADTATAADDAKLAELKRLLYNDAELRTRLAFRHAADIEVEEHSELMEADMENQAELKAAAAAAIISPPPATASSSSSSSSSSPSSAASSTCSSKTTAAATAVTAE